MLILKNRCKEDIEDWSRERVGKYLIYSQKAL